MRDRASMQKQARIADILAQIQDRSKFTVSDKTSIEGALAHLVEQQLASCLTLNAKGEVSGLFTARDILRFIHENKRVQGGPISSNNNSNGSSSNNSNSIHNGGKGIRDLLSPPISDIATRKEKLVYCSPSDTVRKCREIMFQLHIRHLPVIENGEVLGVVSMNVLADSYFSLKDSGGKKGFINITGRMGLPAGTIANATASAALEQTVLAMDVASHALPHPYKRADGVAHNRRQYGAHELSSDLSMCEDAHFAIRVPGDALAPGPSGPGTAEQVYLCVADGVGSWRQYDVDPREFSHRLVANARRVIETDAEQRRATQDMALEDSSRQPIHPLDVVIDAWNQTCNDKVTGSSTVCVATLDAKLNQLLYTNLGDCGLMVLRHIDSEIAGYMRERKTPRHMRKHDLRIAYLSQQQLRSFNLPYQLGFSDVPQHTGKFETPFDADTASISVMAGDIILLATDGLFDNLDLDEIVAEVSKWEDEWFASVGGDLQLRGSNSQEALDALARRMVEKARELSLDTKRDSPFALLAKENDIMWGGGMPDDTTVVVARLFKQ